MDALVRDNLHGIGSMKLRKHTETDLRRLFCRMTNTTTETTEALDADTLVQVILQEKKRASNKQNIKMPPPPTMDIQQARILSGNPSLVKHLREHELGDFVKNPYRKVAGENTTKRSKISSEDTIKRVITKWLGETPEGRRALAAANISSGELTIDRVIARQEKHSQPGQNCIYNLYMMPFRHNCYFNNILSDEKKAYIGELAWKIAAEANEAFVRDLRDTQGDYNWDTGSYHSPHSFWKSLSPKIAKTARRNT